MQIIITEQDMIKLRESSVKNLFGVITDIVRKNEPTFNEYGDENEAMQDTEPLKVAPAEEAPAKKRKRAAKAEPKEEPKPEPEPEVEESEPDVEEQDEEEDLGLDDEEEQPTPKPKRSRKEMFTAIQVFCKADKANARKVREAIKELGIAKVTNMTDEQMIEICEDMGI